MNVSQVTIGRKGFAQRVAFGLLLCATSVCSVSRWWSHSQQKLPAETKRTHRGAQRNQTVWRRFLAQRRKGAKRCRVSRSRPGRKYNFPGHRLCFFSRREEITYFSKPAWHCMPVSLEPNQPSQAQNLRD